MELERVGPYRIEKLLGSGGMGAVYLAWDARLSRQVAIKFIPDTSLLSEENRERLRREARAVAGLHHASLTEIYDILTENGREYIVMEFVEGVALSMLFVPGRLSIERTLNLSRQIAEGLKVAHDAGLVHRDLKAENILITADDSVKILDFGVAKRINSDASEESLTQEGIVMGTTRAMSPEQAEGRRVDQRSDLFSLGSLMYEMLTGMHPFQHSSPLETMQRVVRHHPTPARDFNKQIAKPLQTLLDRLMEKDRDKRISDAGDVIEAIAAIQNQESNETVDSPEPTIKKRWWRYPWLPFAGALVILSNLLTLLI